MEATCQSHAVAPWLPKAPWRGLRIARIRRHLIAHGIEMVLLSHIVPQTKTLRRMCRGGWRSIVSGTQNKTSPLSTERVSSAAVLLQKSIPIIIPCFNTVTYVRLMVEQLRNLGLSNIILIDNASSYPPMVSYLSEISSHVQVVWQKENKGPRDIFSDPCNRSLLPQFFLRHRSRSFVQHKTAGRFPGTTGRPHGTRKSRQGRICNRYFRASPSSGG